MESDIALELFKKAPKQGVVYQTLIEDENTAVISKLTNELEGESATIKKLSDANHIALI